MAAGFSSSTLGLKTTTTVASGFSECEGETHISDTRGLGFSLPYCCSGVFRGSHGLTALADLSRQGVYGSVLKIQRTRLGEQAGTRKDP